MKIRYQTCHGCSIQPATTSLIGYKSSINSHPLAKVRETELRCPPASGAPRSSLCSAELFSECFLRYLSMRAQQSQRSGYRTAPHEQCRPLPGCHSPLPVRDLAEARWSSEVCPPIHWEGRLTQATVYATYQRPSGYPCPSGKASRDLKGPVTLGGSNNFDSNKCTKGTSLFGCIP